MNLRFLSAGDRGLVVEFGDRVERALSAAVLRLEGEIRQSKLAGVVETVPTFRSLMVYYDPLATSRSALEGAISGLLDRPAAMAGSARRWKVPVCYEGEHAPDLAEVARLVGLTPKTVAERHSAIAFHVYMLGFLPGFPYMGDLPEALALPRRADPRLRVPAGSIAIATTLTAIYPYESPGGWHLIGATPIRLFDNARARPALLAPGDEVRVEPIDADRFAAIRRAAEEGNYVVESEPAAP
jgi:inhibitor of KinA